MYEFEIEPIARRDPWRDVAFRDRYAAMCQRSGHRVAYFYAAPDTSTFRYRCWNMAETLNRYSDRASAGCFYRDESAYAEEIVDAADVIVLCRMVWDQHVSRIISLARAKKRPLLFDIDDMVFDPSTINIVMRALGVGESEDDWRFWFAYASRHQAVLKACDGAISTTSALAAMLRENLPQGRIEIVPNFLNAEQLSVSHQSMKEKSRQGYARDGNTHIGYFSGTPTHARDFAVAEKALARLLDEQPALRLLIVGFLEPGEALARFSDRIDRHNLVDYRTLQLLHAKTELSIAPLQASLFTNCKSQLKWFESAIAGSIAVASPTDPFVAVVEQGHNGFLAPAGDWYETLNQALEQVDNTDFITRSAADAEQRFGWQTMAPVIERAVFGS